MYAIRSYYVVVIHHDGHVLTGGLAYGPHNGDVLLHGGIADLCLDALEPLRRPAFGSLRATFHAIVTDCTIWAHGLLFPAQQPHQRNAVNAGKRIPKRHVDRSERDTDKALRSKQTKSLGKFLLYLGRCQHFPFYQDSYNFV